MEQEETLCFQQFDELAPDLLDMLLMLQYLSVILRSNLELLCVLLLPRPYDRLLIPNLASQEQIYLMYARAQKVSSLDNAVYRESQHLDPYMD